MKKMKTLFKKDYLANNICLLYDEVTEGCEWVLNGEGKATQKFDGTCCLVQDGKLYARYDFKVGKKNLPDGAIPCQDNADEVTGHFPHWVEVKEQPQYKWHKKAFERQLDLENGTYELIGVHFQGNPEKINKVDDILIKHGSVIFKDVPRTFDGLREWLSTHNVEGIVFHRENGDMCKIKRSDFNLEWNGKKTKR